MMVKENNGDCSRILDDLNVRVVGSGKRVLVLSHGFGSDQSVWQHILPHLLTDFKLVLYDLRFSGNVNPELFDFDSYKCIADYATDLLNILEELEVQKCFYVGHSVSAMIGCVASIKRPQLFEKLVLLCGSPRYLNDGNYFGGFEREDVDNLLKSMVSDYPKWVSIFARQAVVSKDGESHGAVEEYSASLMKMKPKIAVAVGKSIFESDMRSILGDVKSPCAIIQTTNDMAVPAGVADYLQRHINNNNIKDNNEENFRSTDLHILPSDGHLPHLTSPVLLVQHLKHIFDPVDSLHTLTEI